MGNMGPPRASDRYGLKLCDNKRKRSDEHLGREQLSDNEEDSPVGHWHNSPKKSHYYELEEEKEPSLSHSGDGFGRRLERKSHHEKYLRSDVHHVERHKSPHSSSAGRDKRLSHTERSYSDKEDFHRSSNCHRDGRHKHHHGESKKYPERRGYHDNDSSLGHHSTQKDVKRRAEPDVRGSHKDYHSFTGSGRESSSPNDRKGGCKERHLGHDSRHSRHSGKHVSDKQHAERQEKAVNASEEEHRDEYHFHKRRAL